MSGREALGEVQPVTHDGEVDRDEHRPGDVADGVQRGAEALVFGAFHAANDPESGEEGGEGQCDVEGRSDADVAEEDHHDPGDRRLGGDDVPASTTQPTQQKRHHRHGEHHV